MQMTKAFSIFSLCLILFSGLPGILSSAAAQQQEKRIALVVGDGAYAKSPLATAANDAGLIAQTLQAAGFDVVGARDLDGDTLRGSFRDFIQKAQGVRPGHGRDGVSFRLRNAARRRKLFHTRRLPAQPRHRHSDRRIADQRLPARSFHRFR